MLYRAFSVSTLALVMATANLSVAKADITATSKDVNLKGDGLNVASTDDAKGPGLEISGGTSFNAYAFNQLARGAKGRGTHFGADNSRINFEVSGKAGPRLDCLEYSFLIGMTGNTEANTTAVEENRVKLKHRFGTVMAGVHRGVTDFMSVGAFTFHKGTGNVFGISRNIRNETTGSVLKDDPKGHAKDRTKFTYITPRFALGDFGGIQLGYSHTPDGEQRGEAKLNTLTSAPGGIITAAGQNLHEFAVNFKGQMLNGFGAQVSFSALLGQPKMLKTNDAPNAATPLENNLYGARSYHDIKSYAIGAVVSYEGFSLGGEYLNNTNSLTIDKFSRSLNTVNGGNPVHYTVNHGDGGRVYNIGVGYAQGRHGMSLGFLKSDRCLGTAVDNAGVQDDINFGTVTSKVYSASYDYKVAKGLKVYGEVTHFDMCQSNADNAKVWNSATTGAGSFVGNNNGNAFIAGVALSF